MSTNPTRMLLLRHAETTHPHTLNGAESDVGLSERGLRQAQAIAPVLAAENPVAVVSSGMRRAIDTATPIALACGLPLPIEPDLHERRVGELNGQRFDAIAAFWTDVLSRWKNGETSYAPGGGESLDDVRARVVPVFERLAEEFAGQTYVVVAHGNVCKVLLLSSV